MSLVRTYYTPPSVHIHTRPECGICGWSFTTSGTRIRAIHSSEVSDSYNIQEERECQVAHGAKVEKFHCSSLIPCLGRVMCWMPKCPAPSPAPEMAVVHADCYTLFKAECQTEDRDRRLWAAIKAREPWDRALRLQLLPSTDGMEVIDQVLHWAEACGLPGLKKLPPELIQMIANLSKSAALLHGIAAILLGRELRDPSYLQRPLRIVPLRYVVSWLRGQEPRLSQTIITSSLMRLTYDSRGIRKIETLPEKGPVQVRRRENTKAYTVIQMPGLEVMAWFQFGILRLNDPGRISRFHIWDVSNPPDDLSFMSLLGREARIRTIDLQRITGLTFFYSSQGRQYGIHAHTMSEPTALSTFNQVSRYLRSPLVWVYIPIAKNDRITAFGIRLDDRWGGGSRPGNLMSKLPGLLFRTKLAGDITAGAHFDQYVDKVLSDVPPTLLLYESASDMRTRNIGVYPSPPAHGGGNSFTPFSPLWNDRTYLTLHGVLHVSGAPLSGVTRVQIFQGPRREPSLQSCRGIILDYENGAQRAVGECQLGGVDTSTVYTNIKRICFRRPGGSVLLASQPNWWGINCQVEAGSDLEHSHGEHEHIEWTCFHMQGNLFSEIMYEHCAMGMVDAMMI
ncbi:hypothetical protein G7054_g9728 [Neopestalotiopsis clavispora]|nr:hypothetical protein G7054_g9728 [Neopestalotiopsis clavispora]